MGTAAGQILEDADLTALKQASSEKPIGRITVSGGQNIAHNSYTALIFNTEDIDTHGQHDLVTNTTRVTPNVPGVYRFHGTLSIGGRTDFSFVEVTVRPNGGTPIAPSTRDRPPLTDAATTLQYGTTALVECDGSTDYVEIVARQVNAASAVQITAQSVHLTCSMEWEKIRDL